MTLLMLSFGLEAVVVDDERVGVIGVVVDWVVVAVELVISLVDIVKLVDGLDDEVVVVVELMIVVEDVEVVAESAIFEN